MAADTPAAAEISLHPMPKIQIIHAEHGEKCICFSRRNIEKVAKLANAFLLVAQAAEHC